MQLLGWHGRVICKNEAAAHKVSLNELDVRDWQSLTFCSLL